MAAAPATVAECELSQTQWNTAIAVAGGGSSWEDRGLRWSWQEHDRQLMLNFPRAAHPAAVRDGLEFALERNARIVGAWLSPETDVRTLESAGFERGWEPWWMAARLDAMKGSDDRRVVLCTDVPEYGPGGQRLLSLARGEQPRARHAVARVDGHFAGRAWSLVDGPVAGVYDMEVWPRFQRRGLGRALLRIVCQAARAAGANRAVLNATPQGERLYSAEGFVHVGRGITYWYHLSRAP
ncbi:MAG: GNAT family N-acetyltransferase [Solirubrobacterales bacterium]|nr:GNAT family N-acetyltransferase [Solirubrobacterales bacterium]MBV9472767.1 GNAT family N-acetyltransferase [Solirubrobacterales bacterium]MBV9838296.1 GNAT family N-acetyltransferase [Solirubrobacterales bacterium]